MRYRSSTIILFLVVLILQLTVVPVHARSYPEKRIRALSPKIHENVINHEQLNNELQRVEPVVWHEIASGAGESQLSDFGARFLEHAYPARFVTHDPSLSASYDLINPQSFNLYTYCLNNPVKYIDPNGLNAEVFRHTDQNGNITKYEVVVKTEYTFDSNSLSLSQATKTASELENYASTFWNSQNITDNGAPVDFNFQHKVRSVADPASPGFDQINFDTGPGISNIKQKFYTDTKKPNPVDSGTIYLGNQNNPSIPPLSGVMPHERGHQMGLPDLYSGSVSLNNTASGNIMEFAQPNNTGKNWGPFILHSSSNFNVRRDYP